jgi:putative transposase
MIVRGNSRGAIYAEEPDYLAYLGWLQDGAEQHECRIHAYVLMTNHVHLLVSASNPANLSKLPQYVGRRYVPYFNRKYGRSGTLWEGRFKASTIESERYLLTCYRYIEMNPVRAGMVATPGDYRWSSYKANACGKESALISPHPLYLALGDEAKQRAKRYRDGFKEVLDSDVIDAIRASVQTGTPLGTDRFKAEVERLLGMRVGQARRGRPSKRENAVTRQTR